MSVNNNTEDLNRLYAHCSAMRIIALGVFERKRLALVHNVNVTGDFFYFNPFLILESVSEHFRADDPRGFFFKSKSEYCR